MGIPATQATTHRKTSHRWRIRWLSRRSQVHNCPRHAAHGYAKSVNITPTRFGTCGALCLFIGTNRLAPSWLRRGRVFRRMSLVDTTPSAPPPHTQPRGGAFLATTATRHHRQLGPKSETWDRVSGLGPCLDGSLWAEGRYDRFQNWRADLICRKPTIIPTPSSVAATPAARTQTSPKQGSPIIAYSASTPGAMQSVVASG